MEPVPQSGHSTERSLSALRGRPSPARPRYNAAAAGNCFIIAIAGVRCLTACLTRRSATVSGVMQGDESSLRHRFRDVVTSEEQLRAVLGQPTERAVAKVVRVIDDHARRFIAHAPFVFVASAGADGTLDVSPKGDPAGFVKVLDDRTLAIPDRPGNRRIDTFRNVLSNPNVGLIFLIPGVTHTLRMAGKAIIVRDTELREAMAANGKLPEHILIIEISHVLSHCPKCMIRSGMWRPEAWPDTSNLPSFAEMLVAHGKLAETVEEMQTIIDTGNRDRLY